MRTTQKSMLFYPKKVCFFVCFVAKFSKLATDFSKFKKFWLFIASDTIETTQLVRSRNKNIISKNKATKRN